VYVGLVVYLCGHMEAKNYIVEKEKLFKEIDKWYSDKPKLKVNFPVDEIYFKTPCIFVDRNSIYYYNGSRKIKYSLTLKEFNKIVSQYIEFTKND